jgi:Flp pilus assembly protein TadG
MRTKRRRYGWDEGATAVEAAITLSLALALIFGVIQFGLTVWQLNTMQLAVEQAGRTMMINSVNGGCITPACAEAQMETVLSSYVGFLPAKNQTCSVANGNPNPPAAGNVCVYASPPTAGNPQTMTLTAVYTYNFSNFILPAKLLLGGSGPLTATNQATFPLD